MNSKRLPGKVLMNISGKPMLQWQIERLQKSRLIDNIVIATTNASKDDPIEALCGKLKVKCFRGSESDVLLRVSELLDIFKVDIHIECFGDSPLIDPQIVDEFIGYYLKECKDIDYLSSAIKSTYPAGLEVSIYKSNILKSVNKMVDKSDPLREHVGFNITRFSKSFKLVSLEAPEHFCKPNIYLEVDTEEDMNLMKEVIGYFSSRGINYFGLNDILIMLNNNPGLASLNKDVKRKWKELRKSNIN